jgi:hypothetical protein
MDFIKRIVPKSIKTSPIRDFYYYKRFVLELAANYFYDFRRFQKYSATGNLYGSKRRYEGRILAHCHQIEKGLSLKVPRPGFGQEVIRHLVAMLKSYQAKYGLDENGKVALKVLFGYYEFNLFYGIKNEKLFKQLQEIKIQISDETWHTQDGGTIALSKDEIIAQAAINF